MEQETRGLVVSNAGSGMEKHRQGLALMQAIPQFSADFLVEPEKECFTFYVRAVIAPVTVSDPPIPLSHVT